MCYTKRKKHEINRQDAFSASKIWQNWALRLSIGIVKHYIIVRFYYVALRDYLYILTLVTVTYYRYTNLLQLTAKDVRSVLCSVHDSDHGNGNYLYIDQHYDRVTSHRRAAHDRTNPPQLNQQPPSRGLPLRLLSRALQRVMSVSVIRT